MERLALRDAPDFIGLLSDPELLQLMLFACPDGVLATDDEHRIVLYTGACEQIFGFPPFEVLHRHVSVLFATPGDYERLRGQLSKDGRVANLELAALRKDAPPFAAAISAAVLKDRYGSYLGTIAYVRDHTDVRNIQDELQNNNEQLEGMVRQLDSVARHDQLTGLLHRGSAIDAAESALLALGLGRRELGVVVFDLDHFKQVNDSHGHLVGDQVLVELASILTSTARETDVIGRFGGEEFIAFLPGASLEDAVRYGNRVRTAIESRVLVVRDAARVHVTVSAGAASVPRCADSLHEAIRVADERLFIAKRAGRNRVIGSEKPEDGRNAA
jgi:diguanylate cyclase (GGDEF)-like protein/PAS domain S-box-containing protein